jgi:hypothetical protein
MSAPGSGSGSPGQGLAYPLVEAERRGWYELVELIRSLTPDECIESCLDGGTAWTVRDTMAHLGTWLAEARVQLEQMNAGTYDGDDVDVDALYAAFLQAMGGQPWEVVWVQANAARNRMVAEWYAQRRPSDEAAWWFDRCAAEHVVSHLDRLRDWTTELIARRTVD